MFKLPRHWFSTRTKVEKKKSKIDPVNTDYICLPNDPIRTMNSLKDGSEWHMNKVHAGLQMGQLRHPTESEVDLARKAGRVK